MQRDTVSQTLGRGVSDNTLCKGAPTQTVDSTGNHMHPCNIGQMQFDVAHHVQFPQSSYQFKQWSPYDQPS